MFSMMCFRVSAPVIAFALVTSWTLEGAKGRSTIQDEPTVVEDAIGVYEVESFKKQLSASASNISDNIRALGDSLKNISGDGWKKGFQAFAEDAQQTMESIQQTAQSTKSYLEQVYDGITDNIRTFTNQFKQNLSNLKLFVEQQSRQLETVLRQTGLASRQILASDCFDLFNLRYNASGTYYLQKFGLKVLCDMETDGGGWLVIQRRAKVSSQVDFNRDWFSYKIGFGELDTEFWIGNDLLHALTNQKPYEVRIDMDDFENGTFYATYSSFRVGSEDSSYRLDVGNYSGNASDAFTYHHTNRFTTYDRDNDDYSEGNCATYFSGGWWYDRCYDAHLNGIFPDPPDRSNASYISWWSRISATEKVPLVLTKVVIKIRPKVQ